jgi:hypothetical protein
MEYGRYNQLRYAKPFAEAVSNTELGRSYPPPRERGGAD